MAPESHPQPIELKLPPESGSVARARKLMRRYAAELGADAEAVALAVSEAMSNAVLHAYRGVGKRRIALCAEPAADGCLVVTVIDRGVGMQPDPDAGGLGLGLPLIGLVADSVDVSTHAGSGVELRMRFRRSV
jgi:anti-sigma regulatory factor (Ser/Thr protein kinase)